MRILALTDGSIEAASALAAFDGKTRVDMHIPLAPLPEDMRRPDLIIMAYRGFPEFGMQPLFAWLEKHDLSAKPRILCIPRDVARQYSASVRLFANQVLPLPVRPAVMMDIIQRLDTRLPRIRKQERNETAATVQSTARTFISAFSTENTNPSSTVAALTAATTDVCKALEKDGLDSWMRSVSDYHSATARHAMSVAGFASVWAQLLGVKGDDLRMFTRGALMHDIGKMEIPLEILDKTESLTPKELALFRSHPEHGKRILEEAGEPHPLVIDMAYNHHERLDGSGYPRGLTGKQISDMVRCIAIVDCYAELIDPFGATRALTPLEAYGKLETMTDGLDKNLVGAFRPVVEAHREVMRKAA